MEIFIICSIVLVILIVGFVWLTYNKMVRLRNSVDDGFSQIEVQEQQRYDQINQQIEAVKGYAKHEKAIFEEFAKARQNFSENINSTNRGNTVNDVNQTSEIARRANLEVNALAEQYPELKANENFLDFQRSIESLESKIASARRYYNGTVKNYRDTKNAFPANIVLKMFNFEDKEMFTVQTPEAKKAPKIEF